MTGVPLIRDYWVLRKFLAEMTNECDLPAIEVRIGVLDGPHFASRFSKSLGLLDQLKNKDLATEALVLRLSDPNPRMRALATYSLLHHHASKFSREAVTALVGSLSDDDIDVGVCAELALAQIGPSTVDELVAKYSAQSVRGRLSTLRLLGKSGRENTSALSLLLEATEDVNRFLQSSAFQSLGEWGEAASGAIERVTESMENEEDRSWRLMLGIVLWKINDNPMYALQALREIIHDGEHMEIIAAMYALAELEKDCGDAIPIVAPLAQNDDREVRLQLTWALRRVHASPELVIPVLRQLANDEDYDVKDSSLSVLDEFDQDRENGH
jgi:HEAT repeat protein